RDAWPLSAVITSAPSLNNAARARSICEGRGLAESASPPLGRNHARHPPRHFHPRRGRRAPVASVPDPGPQVPGALDLHHPDPGGDESPPRGPPPGVPGGAPQPCAIRGGHLRPLPTRVVSRLPHAARTRPIPLDRQRHARV